MTTVLYARQSQDRDGDELGITRQRADAGTLAQARGWTIAREFVDNDISAAGKRERPGFNALIAAIERGEVKVIIAWSLDRLTRNRRDQLRLIEACETTKVLISLCRGSDIDMSTPAGQLVADVLAGVARHEIAQKADRQRRAQAQAAQDGRRVGGRRAFGYELDGITVRPQEADAVRAAYRDITVGVPLAEIARRWNGAGLRSGQAHSKTWAGKPRTASTRWTHDTVRLVILNPRNKGRRRYNGEETSDAVWPAIVSEETWQAAVDVLRNPSRWSGAKAEQQLLTGVAVCWSCGDTVHGGGASHGKPVYRCGSGRHVNRLMQPVDDYVSDCLLKWLAQHDKTELLVDEQRPDLDALRSELSAKRARLNALAVEFAEDDTLTPQQLRIATERLRSRITQIEAAMADAGRVDVLGELAEAEDAEEARAVWSRMGKGRRRAVIATLMTVTLHSPGRGTRTFRPETVDIQWKPRGAQG